MNEGRLTQTAVAARLGFLLGSRWTYIRLPFRQLGMTRGVAENLAGLAAVSASCGRPAEAARLWGAAETLHERDGTPV
jgi:hypothetical protein